MKIGMMDDLGQNLSFNGSVMEEEELLCLRKKREDKGLCINCGRKCYRRSKSTLRLVPINKKGEVKNGKCLKCNSNRYLLLNRRGKKPESDRDLSLALQVSMSFD